jgi:hypothetical protein
MVRVRVRLTHGKHRDHEGVQHEAPAELEVPEHTLAAHADRFEVIEDEETDGFDDEDADAESEDSSAGEAPEEEFDPAGFVDAHWRTVVDAVRAGDADGHLVEVREAEEAREAGPRESVMDAVYERAAR